MFLTADGICCLYGRGSLAISDSDTAIWRHRGDYGIYLKVVFDMDTQGNLVFVTETSNYEASWEAYDAPNSPPSIDPDWPGAMPTANRNAVMINVKFDAYPGETTWQFQSYTLGEWRTIKSFSGVEDGVHNELVSVEVEAISEGWYRYAIQDSQNDGICCRYRRGWISITGPIITTQAQGLVWGNNGEFGSSFDVYIRMNSDGFLDRVSYTDPMATSATTRGHTDYNDRRQLRKAQLRKWQ